MGTTSHKLPNLLRTLLLTYITYLLYDLLTLLLSYRHYIAVARNVCGQYFGWALGLAQTVSVCGLFAQGVLKNTYLVCGMAEQGMLPRALAARMPYTNSPYVALLATTIILVLIMPLRTFKTILGVDIDLYCLALLLEIGAFIRLRSTQPDRPREYRIPVDGVWVYLVFIPAIIITVAGVVLGGDQAGWI